MKKTQSDDNEAGFLMAPISFTWFGFLSEIFPVTTESQTGPALWRVALDQLVFSPICELARFTQNTGIPTDEKSCSFGIIFHLHDTGRRRWEKGGDAKI